MIDKFIEIYFNAITYNDLKVGNFTVLDKNIIMNTFNEINRMSNTSLENKIELTIERLCKHIDEYNSSIIMAIDLP